MKTYCHENMIHFDENNQVLIHSDGSKHPLLGNDGNPCKYAQVCYCDGGFVLVSTLGEQVLAYFDEYNCITGMWGICDSNGSLLVEPQYIMAFLLDK